MLALNPQSVMGRRGKQVYSESLVQMDSAAFWLERNGATRTLSVLAPAGTALLTPFEGVVEEALLGTSLKLCPTTDRNARALRQALPWLRPRPLGLVTSAGFGDRLGLATPGHVRALRRDGNSTIAPIFAQQSIREMTRTDRTPAGVLSDATWGALQASWQGVLGADADHLKTTADIDATVAAGYSLFTIDPGEYVDDAGAGTRGPELRAHLERLPWTELESDSVTFLRTYTGRTFDLETRSISLDEESVARAGVKYGRAVAHVTALSRHLAAAGIPFELEVSVDETATPTSHVEHIVVALELRRLGVWWVSLAPRFVGRFEKGVDYIGNVEVFAADVAVHATIARVLGPYKLSVHSGSDKFSIYPAIAAATGTLVHLKTAGTSYLEALRLVALVDPDLFLEILTAAMERYAVDRASYHVSADPVRLPPVEALPTEGLTSVLDDFTVRQVLHVTFGSILATYRDAIVDLLETHEDGYTELLAGHLGRHLRPFAHPDAMPPRAAH